MGGPQRPRVLKQCIPGCQEIERESDTSFSAKVKSRIGPVSATFKGKVTLSDLNPPNAYTISGEGQGGVAGFAKGSTRVTLDEDGAATVLRYDADGQVGGKLAQIGARLAEDRARKVADDFFTTFNDLVAVEAAPVEEEMPVMTEPAETPAPNAPPRGRSYGPPFQASFENLLYAFVGLVALVLIVAAMAAQ